MRRMKYEDNLGYHTHSEEIHDLYKPFSFIKKVKLSHYMPWRHMGGR
jgi:hypothetical protein